MDAQTKSSRRCPSFFGGGSQQLAHTSSSIIALCYGLFHSERGRDCIDVYFLSAIHSAYSSALVGQWRVRCVDRRAHRSVSSGDDNEEES